MQSLFRPFAIGFYFLCVVSFPQQVSAHGDLHERISELSVQIKADGKNAAIVYFERGELYRQHGDWTLALRDFNAAEKRSSKIVPINFARGRTLFAAERFYEAKVALDKYIAIAPTHAEALAMRAQTLAKLGNHADAVDDFTRAINNFAAPDLDCFLQRADSLIALGQSRVALAGLEEGMQKFGPVISFQLRAIELEIALKNYPSALSRLDSIIVQSPRKETWLARRGEILEQAGRRAEAEKTYLDALNALEGLPASRRAAPAMNALETQIRGSLTGLQNFSTAQNSNAK